MCAVMAQPSQFRLTDLAGERLRKLLGRAVGRRYCTVPWPVADYDAGSHD